MTSVTFAVSRQVEYNVLEARYAGVSNSLRHRAVLFTDPVDNILADVYNEVSPPNLAA